MKRVGKVSNFFERSELNTLMTSCHFSKVHGIDRSDHLVGHLYGFDPWLFSKRLHTNKLLSSFDKVGLN